MKATKAPKNQKDPKAEDVRPALASPYELASVAIALASLQQKTEPDIEGAVKLLRVAAMRAQTEKRPMMLFPDSVLCDDEAGAKLNREAFERMGAKTVVQSPLGHPGAYREAIGHLKSFKGASAIRPPKHFPAPANACWRAILKRSPGKLELARKKAAILKACPSAALSINVGVISSEMAFWSWARGLMPHLPRRGEASKRASRSRKKSSAGQFTKPRQGSDGRFKK